MMDQLPVILPFIVPCGDWVLVDVDFRCAFWGETSLKFSEDSSKLNVVNMFFHLLIYVPYIYIYMYTISRT